MKPEQPTSLDAVYRLDENAEWKHLLDYLGMLEGFGLIVLLAPEQAGVDVCRRTLQQHFGKDKRALHVLRVIPGERPGALGDRLLNDPLPKDAAAVWVDAAAPKRATADAPLREHWRLALAALNPRRNPLRRQLPVPLIFAGPAWLQEVFREAAPDLWSIRDTIIRIEPPQQEHRAAAALDIRLDSPAGQAEGEPGDPDETRRALDRLAEKKVSASQRREYEALRARLLQRLGNQLRRLYRWDEAEAALREAEAVMEDNPGSVGDQGALLFDLGLFYDAQGNLQRSEHYARKSYEFCNAHYGSENPDTLTSRNNLANALNAQGKHAEAEQENRAVLAMRERVLGPENPNVLQSRDNLAHALYGQGKHTEAEQELRAVLAMRERVLGPEHPATFQSRNNLALALDVQGKHAEAEQEHRAVLAARERMLGMKHPEVFQSCYNLALALKAQGKLAEALAFAQRAREGWQEVFGGEHPYSKHAKTLCEEIEAKLAKQGAGKPE